MSKQIQVKIVKIKYSGDSVGDDIRIDVECLDKFVSFDKQIKHSSVIDMNLEIGNFISGNKIFSLPLNIKVIEKDLVFNDIGESRKNLKINLSANTTITSEQNVEVQELRNFISLSKAVFEITLEITVSDAILYIGHSDDGWISIFPENSKTQIALPHYLKVLLEKNESNRQYFKILEGISRGSLASIKYDENGRSFLEDKNQQTKSVHIIYSISKKTVHFKNKVYKTIDYPGSPWKKGIYDLEIPDAPHRGGQHYPEASMAKTWFRIGHSGKRYFHPGAHSSGCITLTEISRWDELCDILLKARKGDGISVGILEVID